jgi:hypothetical protein
LPFLFVFFIALTVIKSHFLCLQKQHHSELQMLQSTKDKEVVRLQRQVQVAEKNVTKMLEKEKRPHEAHVDAVNREERDTLPPILRHLFQARSIARSPTFQLKSTPQKSG